MLDILKSEARKLYERGYISEEEYIIRKGDGRFSKVIVISAVISIMAYAVVMMQFTYLNILNHTQVYPPTDFTAGYFAFWTVEIVMLASIRRSKVKNKHEREEVPENQSRISPGGIEKDQPEKGL